MSQRHIIYYGFVKTGVRNEAPPSKLKLKFFDPTWQILGAILDPAGFQRQNRDLGASSWKNEEKRVSQNETKQNIHF